MTDQPKSRNSELKPCPCCGGEARFDENSDGGHYIECNGCGLTTCLVFNLMGGADRKLSEVWNRRVVRSERLALPEALQGEWTPSRCLHLGQAAEIEALCKFLNDSQRAERPDSTKEKK